jgi:hydrogenase maturation protein HypF
MIQRRAITLTGVVQGVGLRPFVFGEAERLGLRGFVKNRVGGVLIEAEGEPPAIDALVEALKSRPPPLARVASIEVAAIAAGGEDAFRIAESDAPEGEGQAFVIGPDAATCEACKRELEDPSDRRHGYPFLNCTNCGPRLTIVTGAPYDRGRTTMSAFPMCVACRAEYDDPRDRRFHAQPTACPVCGPTLRAVGPTGEAIAGDPIELAVEAIRRGEIVAVKGIGGFHLACDATNEGAVEALRRRKQRDAKPFALMVRDVRAALALAHVDDTERAALESPQRAIVLLQRKAGTDVVPGVAPGSTTLGLMLPYAPVHHLLLARLGGTPLVLTSANKADAPIAYEDDDALARLAGVAHIFLVHDRRIATLCDDSVVRVLEGGVTPVRRSRGYAPEPLPLLHSLARPTLALGGHLKATFALGSARRAWVSHHLGDLDGYEALRAYETSIAHYEALFRVRPERLVHDMHPDYASTRYALERAAREGIETLAIQHHHAHVAGAMASHGLARAIGVAFDGTGFGSDGGLWGGEILAGEAAAMRRVGHLGRVRAPGGDRAAREPWRMALAHLIHAGEEEAASRVAVRAEASVARAVRAMIERGVNAPATSSAGRLFDAVASIVALHDRAAFEGEAAMHLEALAASANDAVEPYPFEVIEADGMLVIDPRPIVRGAARDAGPPPRVARRFHATLAAAIAAVCAKVRDGSGLDDVVLSGGCFVNAVLTAEVCRSLRAAGLRPHVPRHVPPNDGGISFGQLAVVSARDAGGAR